MEIKNRYTGKVVYRCDSKTMKETVENAILSKIDLSECDLSGSNLSGSNLSGSNLRGSNLSECDLSECDLSGSNLRGSNLSGSNLRWSDLRGSNLRGSNLRGSAGLHYAKMSFSGFGENNRLITLADVNRDGNPIFFCGCFSGTNEELIDFIELGYEIYKESRHFARKTLLEAIKFSKNN